MGPALTRLTGAFGRLTGAAFWLLLLASPLPTAALLWLTGAVLAYPRTGSRPTSGQPWG